MLIKEGAFANLLTNSTTVSIGATIFFLCLLTAIVLLMHRFIYDVPHMWHIGEPVQELSKRETSEKTVYCNT
jgi:hypothetical protein